MPLLLVSLVVVLVAFGLSRGLWLSNLHNGLLALAFTLVGAYVLFQRPGHREGLLFMAAGVVEGVMFLGRQVGHAPSSEASRWWGWLGVWPLGHRPGPDHLRGDLLPRRPAARRLGGVRWRRRSS